MKEIGLILLGFVLSWIPLWLDRKRRIKAHWSSIRAEMELCRSRAATLISDSIQSPLYRLPTVAYETALPVLLAEGAMSESEAFALGEFFCTVQDVNRGLDNAASMLNANDKDGLNREYSRNLLKAGHLTDTKDTALYPKAKKIIDAKVSLPLCGY